MEFFVADKKAADYFDAVAAILGNENSLIALASNYITSDLTALSEKENFYQFPKPEFIAELVKLIGGNELSSRGAKEVLGKLVLEEYSEKTPKDVAKELGVVQVSDPDAIKKVIQQIIDENASVVSEYKAGKQASLQFLIGQAMKATKGSANPSMVKDILTTLLG